MKNKIKEIINLINENEELYYSLQPDDPRRAVIRKKNGELIDELDKIRKESDAN